MKVTVGTPDIKSERSTTVPQMTAEDLNTLQSSLDASNSEMTEIRKVNVCKFICLRANWNKTKFIRGEDFCTRLSIEIFFGKTFANPKCVNYRQ